MQNQYEQLASINVNEHVESKNGLTYLSWAWALDQILRQDPDASWSYGEPKVYAETMMVFCTVRAFGRERTAQLPVMDHKHRPILNPDAYQVNTAMQRALAKAVALHGLGLYIYAGEDLPDANAAQPAEQPSEHTRQPVTPIRKTVTRQTEATAPTRATLTPAQQAEIQRRAKEVNADLSRLLAYFRVERLEDLPASDYERVIRSLDNRRRAA